MSCERIEHLLAEYVDGTLPPEEKARVDEHLRQCSTCAGDVAELQRLMPVIRTVPEQLPPQGMVDEIFAATTRRKPRFLKKRRVFRLRFSIVPAAASILVALVAVFAVLSNPEMADRLPKKSAKVASEKAAMEEQAGEMLPDAFEMPESIFAPEPFDLLETGMPSLVLEPSLVVTRSVTPKKELVSERRRLAPTALSTRAVPEPSGVSASDRAVSERVTAVVVPPSGPATVSTEDVERAAGGRAATPKPSPGAGEGVEADETAALESTARYYRDERRERRRSESAPPPAVAPAPDRPTAGMPAEVEEPIAEEGRIDAATGGQSLPVLHRWDGQRCAVHKAATLMVTTSHEWNRLWMMMQASRLGAGPPPPIDFNRQVAIGVFLGMRPTGGFTVRILDVRFVDGELRVTVQKREPSPGSHVTQSMTQPYSVIVIPRVIDGVRLDRSVPLKVIDR